MRHPGHASPLLGEPSADPLHISARLQGPAERGCAAVGLLRCARDALGEALPCFPANCPPLSASPPHSSRDHGQLEAATRCTTALVAFANHILTLAPPTPFRTYMLRAGRAAVSNAVHTLATLESELLVSVRASTRPGRPSAWPTANQPACPRGPTPHPPVPATPPRGDSSREGMRLSRIHISEPTKH